MNTILKYETLYKKTSTGAVQTWRKERNGNRYRTVSGQLNGAAVTSEWTVVEGRNIGRSNATTPEEQAISEIESQYTKKLAQGGYHKSIDDIDNATFFKPMLADKFDVKHLPTDGRKIFSQPKLDGMRCIATKEGLFSRQGKPILSVPHVEEALIPHFKNDPNLILDGELYSHDLNEDFNQIMHLVKKLKPSAEHLAETKEKIQYHVYDIPSHDGVFSERKEKLDAFRTADYNAIRVVHSSPILVTDPQERLDMLNVLNASYLQKGYEGQIIRVDNGPYENKRSRQLLKRKEFKDEEFTIVSITEGTGNRSGMAGRVTYKTNDNKLFDTNITGGFEYYRELLAEADEYVGGQGTVKFFEYTPDGIPRFGVTVALYKDGRDS